MAGAKIQGVIDGRHVSFDTMAEYQAYIAQRKGTDSQQQTGNGQWVEISKEGDKVFFEGDVPEKYKESKQTVTTRTKPKSIHEQIIERGSRVTGKPEKEIKQKIVYATKAKPREPEPEKKVVYATKAPPRETTTITKPTGDVKKILEEKASSLPLTPIGKQIVGGQTDKIKDRLETNVTIKQLKESGVTREEFQKGAIITFPAKVEIDEGMYKGTVGFGRDDVSFSAAEGHTFEDVVEYAKERQQRFGPVLYTALQLHYQDKRVIPGQMQEDIILPDELRRIGVREQDYEKIAYEQFLGVISPDQAEQQLSQIIMRELGRGPVEPDIAYMKKYGKFGKDEKPWDVIKKEEPAIELKRTPSGEFKTYMDYTKWAMDFDHPSPGIRSVAMGFFAGPTTQFMYNIAKGFVKTGGIQYAEVSPGVSIPIINLFQDKKTLKASVEPMAKFEYELHKGQLNKDYLHVSKTLVTAPIYTNVAIPVAGGAVIGAGMSALKTSFPFIEPFVRKALMGVGIYAVGQTVGEPIYKITTGKKVTTEDIEKSIYRGGDLAMQVGFGMYGYQKGQVVGATTTAKYMQVKGLDYSRIGMKLYMKTQFGRFWGKLFAEEIPAKRFIDPDVASGKTTVPTSKGPIQTLMEMKRYGYDPKTGMFKTVHTAGKRGAFDRTEIQIGGARSSDIYGLYVTPYTRASAHFTGLGPVIPRYTIIQTSLVRPKPSFEVMYTEDVGRFPVEVRHDIEKTRKFQLRSVPDSKVRISTIHELGSSEAEGVIPPFSPLKSMFEPKNFIQRIKGYDKFVVHMGKVIPVYESQVMKGTREAGGIQRMTSFEYLRWLQGKDADVATTGEIKKILVSPADEYKILKSDVPSIRKVLKQAVNIETTPEDVRSFILSHKPMQRAWKDTGTLGIQTGDVSIDYETFKSHVLFGNLNLAANIMIYNLGSVVECPSRLWMDTASMKKNVQAACQLPDPRSCYALMPEVVRITPYFKRTRQGMIFEDISPQEFADFTIKAFEGKKTWKVPLSPQLIDVGGGVMKWKQARRTDFTSDRPPKKWYMRFNESGDLMGQESLNKMERIAEILKKERNITTYTFTAQRLLDFSGIKHLNINFSGFAPEKHLLPQKYNIYRGVKEPTGMNRECMMGSTQKCGLNCAKCLFARGQGVVTEVEYKKLLGPVGGLRKIHHRHNILGQTRTSYEGYTIALNPTLHKKLFPTGNELKLAKHWERIRETAMQSDVAKMSIHKIGKMYSSNQFTEAQEDVLLDIMAYKLLRHELAHVADWGGEPIAELYEKEPLYYLKEHKMQGLVADAHVEWKKVSQRVKQTDEYYRQFKSGVEKKSPYSLYTVSMSGLMIKLFGYSSPHVKPMDSSIVLPNYRRTGFSYPRGVSVISNVSTISGYSVVDDVSYPSYVSKVSRPSVPSVPSVPGSVASVVSVPSVPSAPSYPSVPTFPRPHIRIVYTGIFRPGGGKIGKVKHEPKQGYDVFVKDRYIVKGKKTKKEKFIKVNRVPLNMQDAMGLGATATDESAAMQFKIVKAKGKPKTSRFRFTDWNLLSNKFIRKGKIYQEKRFAAIDTIGEINEISVQGWKAERLGKPSKIKIIKDKPMMDMGFDMNKIMNNMMKNMGF